MTVVALGVDALDPDLIDPDRHPNLCLDAHKRIATIPSHSGEPSTHELWPTIITGLKPDAHGLLLEDGVTWESPFVAAGARLGRHFLPNRVRTRLGAWLLNKTSQDSFRAPASYYSANGIETVFDGRKAATIGIPNYVTDPDEEDREHQLRRSLGDLFERDPAAETGHRSTDPGRFYELCLEMVMIRIARVRRALRSEQCELVFGYTSGLDLIGHVSFDVPGMQEAAYEEIDQFVGELAADLENDDVLLLVSDHGLQGGVHTDEAMVASTDSSVVERIQDVTTVRRGIEHALREGDHEPSGRRFTREGESDQSDRVKRQLKDLGYI